MPNITPGFSLPLKGNGAVVAVSTPLLNLTQTWNNAGVTFTGLTANFTDTASTVGSLLMDLQVAGATKFNVSKSGAVNTARDITINSGNLSIATNTGALIFGLSPDTILQRDAANTLALRNGVNAQSFKAANTYTDASNNEYGVFDWISSANVLTIGTTNVGTGTTRNLRLVVGGVNKLDFGVTTAATWSSATAFAIAGTATFSAGQVGAVRVVTAAGAVTVTTADYAVFINKTVGAATAVSLPANASGLTFRIADDKGDAAANNITITPAAGLIDGAATKVLNTNWQAVTLMGDGTNWKSV